MKSSRIRTSSRAVHKTKQEKNWKMEEVEAQTKKILLSSRSLHLPMLLCV